MHHYHHKDIQYNHQQPIRKQRSIKTTTMILLSSSLHPIELLLFTPMLLNVQVQPWSIKPYMLSNWTKYTRIYNLLKKGHYHHYKILQIHKCMHQHPLAIIYKHRAQSQKTKTSPTSWKKNINLPNQKKKTILFIRSHKSTMHVNP